MQAQARVLFGLAALLNLSVAAGFLFLRGPLLPLLALDPVSGSNAVFVDLASVMIAIFGYAYWRVAQDPVRYRQYIELGIIGKLLAVLTFGLCWLAGQSSWQLAALGASDLPFAVLFLAFLRRHPAA